jgi:hypothetical protein
MPHSVHEKYGIYAGRGQMSNGVFPIYMFFSSNKDILEKKVS